MFTIKNEYETPNGIIIDNIRNIHFEKFSDVAGNLGTSITESHKDDGSSFEYTTDGIYLYRSPYDPNKGLRVYKDVADYPYLGHDDYKLVSKLQERQKNIKLSEFPTGIITIGNQVIGQEIPFYDNSKTIYDYFKEGNLIKRPTEFYLEILKILKEMLDSGILYTDLHSKNFLVNNITEMVNIIDFESNYVFIDNNSSYSYDSMINNLKLTLLNKLNSICGIVLDRSYKNAKTLEEIEEVILEEDYKLKVK